MTFFYSCMTVSVLVLLSIAWTSYYEKKYDSQ